MDAVNFHDIEINNHKITIWDDRFVILRHPEKCDLYEDDHCREHMIKYLIGEGYINDSGVLIFDSYIDFEPE